MSTLEKIKPSILGGNVNKLENRAFQRKLIPLLGGEVDEF